MPTNRDIAVSVLLPIFNGEKYLAKAIESVLDQTDERFELLIADDLSDDRSFGIAESFSRADKRVRCWKNAERLGLFANYNECIKKASAPYLKPLAQDDLFAPKLLSRMIAVLDEHKSVGLVSSAKRWIDSSGKIINADARERANFLQPYTVDQTRSGKEVILESLRTLINRVGEPVCVMFRKEHAGSGFDNRFLQLGDIDYWLRILEHCQYYFLSEPLCDFRKHEESTTRHHTKSLAKQLDWFLLAGKFVHYLKEVPETEAQFCQRLSSRLVNQLSPLFSSVYAGDKVFHECPPYDNLLTHMASLEGKVGSTPEHFQILSFLLVREAVRLSNELSFKQIALDELKNTVNEQEQQLSDKDVELQESRRALDAMGSSLSWKMTAPLRSAKKLFD